MDDHTDQGLIGYSLPAVPSAEPSSHAPSLATIEQPRRRNFVWPLVLFLATCYTTYTTGGPIYAVAVMSILLAHELGHFIQAVRYQVPASLPIFIPMPISPLGTMGAVIAMSGNMRDRRALYDIGITGPLAGLVPTVFISIVGLYMSEVAPVPPAGTARLGDPLLFQFIVGWIFGPVPAGHDIFLHPLAYAGWVGVLLTSVNLFPIGQLDGGHVLYALLRRKAHVVATMVLASAILAVLWTQNLSWSLMLLLLILMGPNHPPTANDDVPLGTTRIILGWLTLLFPIIGFTPTPFMSL